MNPVSFLSRYRMATPCLEYILKKDAAKLDLMRQPALVKKQLKALNEELAGEEGREVDDEIDEQQRRCSPSQIGGHNELLQPGSSGLSSKTNNPTSTCHDGSPPACYRPSSSRISKAGAKSSLGFDILEEEVNQVGKIPHF